MSARPPATEHSKFAKIAAGVAIGAGAVCALILAACLMIIIISLTIDLVH